MQNCLSGYKISSGSGVKREIMPTQESHKPMIRKCKKRKVYSWFKNKIWSADLGDMELISNFIKNFDVYYALLIFIVTMLCVSCSFKI